jgi:hypothetical protein
MKTWKWWARGGLLVAGVPVMSCGSCGPAPECFVQFDQPWDGRGLDGGLTDGGFEGNEGYRLCTSLCNQNHPEPNSSWGCNVPDAGVVHCFVQCTGGRAPPGLQALSTVDGSAGSWVARMAELETAAVPAFERLADELDVHGLNAHARHARQAALEEVRHADAVTRLALRLGHCPAPVKVAAANEVRSLEELAIDNASEGCGREAFGAVLNQWQATHATDDRVQAVMSSIAVEEHSHAAYSFALAQTLSSRLTIPQRRRTREAQEQMLVALGASGESGRMRKVLGLMDDAQTQTAVRTLLDTRRI